MESKSPTCAILANRHSALAGAHGVVLNRCIGNDLLPAIDTLLQGREFVSPDFGLEAVLH